MTLRTMAWDHDVRLSIVVHGKSSPSPLEWSRFVKDTRALGGRDLRVLVCTYGGGPDGAQRRELADAVRNVTVPTVIMTNSIVARGIVTAMHWFNPSMKVLPIDADTAAHRFLALDPNEAQRAMELRRKLERELMLGPFARIAAGASPPPV
jgi:hypothetical protein